MLKPTTPEEYISLLPDDKKNAVERIRSTIIDNLPEGFEERMSYGMISYVVPHRLYPHGYHCNPEQPLPFLSLAAQKNFIALYHMGLYSDQHLMNWFVSEYGKHCKTKLDMGKSCIRFKKINEIPYTLIGELVSKINVQEWIDLYQSQIKNFK